MFRDQSTDEANDLPVPVGPAVGILRSLLRTSQLALYQVRAGRIECLYCAPDMISLAEKVWASHRRDLLSGNSVRTGGFMYRPLIDGRVVGILEAADVPLPEFDTFQTSLLVVTLRMLPEVLRCATASATEPASARMPEGPLSDPRRVMRLALNEAERAKLCACLDRHGWVVSEVARDLRVNRATVYRKMESLGIARASPSPKAPAHRGNPRLAPRYT